MADADDVRRMASKLPYAVEIDSDGFDFRVGGKVSSGRIPSARRAKLEVIRTDIAVPCRGRGEKQALLLGGPDIFFIGAGYDGWPLVMLRPAAVDFSRLAELITDAWRMRAPELTHDQQTSGHPAETSARRRAR